VIENQHLGLTWPRFIVGLIFLALLLFLAYGRAADCQAFCQGNACLSSDNCLPGCVCLTGPHKGIGRCVGLN